MSENQIQEELLNEEKSLDQKIEERRAPLFAEFTKSRKISNILTIVILVIACGGMYLITGEAAWMKALGWGLLVLGLAAMIVYYMTNKKKFEQNTKDYIKFVGETLNDATFENKKFKNIEVTENKIEINDIAGNGAYNEIVRVASRNVSKGDYAGLDFSFAEIAFFKNGPKKGQQQTLFVGKYIDAVNSIKLPNNIVIEIQGKEPMDLPNGVENRAKLFEEGKITIYGDEGVDLKTTLGEQFYSAVKKLPVEEHFLNLVISIWEGHTFVFMSYDDAVVAMPFDKQFNKEAFDSFTADLDRVFKTISVLGK